MDEASVLAERDVLDVVEAVFDLPVTALQCQQALVTSDVRRQTGNAIVDLPLGRISLLPSPFVTEHLGQARPVAVANEISRGNEPAGVAVAPVTIVDGLGIAAGLKGEGG